MSIDNLRAYVVREFERRAPQDIVYVCTVWTRLVREALPQTHARAYVAYRLDLSTDTFSWEPRHDGGAHLEEYLEQSRPQIEREMQTTADDRIVPALVTIIPPVTMREILGGVDEYIVWTMIEQDSASDRRAERILGRRRWRT